MVGFLAGAAGGAVVSIIIKAQDQYSKEFKKVQSTVKNQEKGFAKLKGMLKSTGLGYAAVAGAAVAFATKSVQAFLELERATQSFNIIVGDTADLLLNELRDASNGMVSNFNLMSAANRALSLGIEQNKLPELMKTATALSKVFGRTVTEAFDDITIGIGRQSRMILDNLGIIVNTELAYDRYAKTLGKTAEQLTETEKKQAFVNEVLEQSRGITAALSAATQTHGEKLQKLNATWDNFLGTAGEAIVSMYDLGEELTKTASLYSLWSDDVKDPEALENLQRIGDEIREIADETKRLREENEQFLNDIDTLINDRFPQEIALELKRNKLQQDFINASSDRKDAIRDEIDQIDDELKRYDLWRDKQDLIIEGWQVTEEQASRTFESVENDINSVIVKHDENNKLVDDNIEKMREAGEASKSWADKTITSTDRMKIAFNDLLGLLGKLASPVEIVLKPVAKALGIGGNSNNAVSGISGGSSNSTVSGIGDSTSSGDGDSGGTISRIVSSVGGAISSVGGAISSVVSTVGGAISSAVSSVGGFLGFEEGGTVPRTGLALLHKDEFVVPANRSKGVGTTIIIQNVNGMTGRDLADSLEEELEKRVNIGI